MPKEGEVWVYQEVLSLLGLERGSKLKIGKAHFTISKIIHEDSLKTISFNGFLPKIYISPKGFEQTGLLQFGSTARYKLNFRFEQNFSNDELEAIENQLEKGIDKNLRVLSPNDGRDRLLRVMQFITNFLSLVSLISFFLGLVGLIYLYSGFLRKHQNDMMVLSDVGLSKRLLTMTYFLHLFVLIAIASAVVFGVMMLSSGFIAPIIERAIDFNFDLSLDYRFFLNSALLLFLLSLSIGLPLILPLLDRKSPPLAKMLLSFIPFIVVLLLIAHFVTPVKNVGLFFGVAILLIILVLFVVGSWVLKRLDFSGHLNTLSLSLATKNIIRQRTTSLTLFTAILLCTTFFTLIPQTGASLSSALLQSVDEKPRFFVIDAKEEQIDELSKAISDRGAKL
ncbi:MAG: FtsX-like permease family protein, partial [Campylobacterota bacterium]|nr:FtsX-like permease family protein [Campylobacterota bacterium]